MTIKTIPGQRIKLETLQGVMEIDLNNDGNFVNMLPLAFGANELTTYGGVIRVRSNNCAKLQFKGGIDNSFIEEVTIKRCWVRDISSMFANQEGLTTVKYGEYQGASNTDYFDLVTFDASRLFEGCVSLVNIDGLRLPNMERGVVPYTPYTNIFASCSSLVSIDGIHIDKARAVPSMFLNCTELKTVKNLHLLEASNINMMFFQCSKLETVENIQAPKFRYAGKMFGSCGALTCVTARVWPLSALPTSQPAPTLLFATWTPVVPVWQPVTWLTTSS